jgi:4-alpha-glucanotransferase
VKPDEPKKHRAAGILLHPTSLPSPFGVGDCGPAAYRWVDALRDARQSRWQVLPLGLTGYGDSPYQSFSAFAGNPLLISPELLLREGLLGKADLPVADFPRSRVDFERVRTVKDGLLRLAWDNFRAGKATQATRDFEAFCDRTASWLNDFALFMAFKRAHGGGSWYHWPEELIRRDPGALARAGRELADDIGFEKFCQSLFARQWMDLKNYAHEQGVRLIGDLPIFVACDSADVWTYPELFQLDAGRRPRVVAGVPPDYFSATGQLWGNPLYDWEALRQTGYAWWIDRVRATLEQVDVVRLDHFRGFEAYWEVPAGKKTAEVGRWVAGPGAEFLTALRDALAGLPLIAEDLGVITSEVEALRDAFHLPGMRILQFAFGGATEERFLPHRHVRNTVVYTGTHDNDTTRGWYAALTEQESAFLERYLPGAGKDVAWALIRLAWASVADLAVAPLQDVLDLGSAARMNTPGTASGNWGWRFTDEQLTPAVLERLGELTDTYDR